jgi:hypothetical protein
MMQETTQDIGVENYWVKGYDCYNRQSCNPNFDETEHSPAYRQYSDWMDSGRFYFVQMGARFTDGSSMVINEFRKSGI